MIERLKKSAEETETILCFGIDPVLERIKSDERDTTDKIVNYFASITDKLIDENQISAIKPNYAFFAQYGFEGYNALKKLMDEYRKIIPIILDAKRGDIGKTGVAYAKEVYDFWGADAVTVSSYMGKDSVEPFINDGKLVYVLCRTTNKGAEDFQELKVGKKYLYEKVAEKAVGWGTGLVVGATSDAINRIVKITKGKDIPFLIPGIGAQGGDLQMVLKAIKNEILIHRINASSSLAYAHEKHKTSPEKAALIEANNLNKEISKYVK